MKYNYGWLRQDGWYGRKGSGGGGVSLPQSSSIVFRHDLFDENDTPQIGSMTYTRSGTIAVPTSEYGWTKYGANALPYGTVRESTEPLKGAWMGGSVVNYLLYSEDFTNAAWTAVSGGSATGNTADGPFGASSDADTISGSSDGDGLEQESSQAAAGKTFVFTVFLKATSGTPTVRIELDDAGNTEGAGIDIQLDTNWRRYEVPQFFSASASGNVVCRIIVGNTSTVRAIGAQLENFGVFKAISTTNGLRYRGSSANPYVPTTTAAATSGFSVLSVPFATWSSAVNAGTVSMWVLHEWDWLDNAYQYAFTAGSLLDRLAGRLILADGAADLGINNTSNAKTDTNQYFTQSAATWTHYVWSWDTDADLYKFYRDGELVASSTTARTPFAFTTEPLLLGGLASATYSTYNLDGLMSQAIVWNTQISDADVATVYALKSADAVKADPGTGLLFEVALGTSPRPTTGDPHYWSGERSYGPRYINGASNTLVALDHVEDPVGSRAWNNASSAVGYEFFPNTTNLCLQSEDFTTTWAKINGAEVVTANAVAAPDGNTTADLIFSAVAGYGVEQSLTGATAASREYVFSVYMQRSAGTATPQIRIEDSTNSEGTSATITPSVSNGTWDRYSVYHSFSSGATGDIKVKIITGDSTGSGLYWWGAQAERMNVSFGNFTKVATPYVPTTTTSRLRETSTIVYRAKDSINYKKGTLIAWGWSRVDNPDEYIVPNGPTIMGAPGQNSNFYLHFLKDEYKFDYNATGNSYATFANTPFQWTHYAASWDLTAATPTFNLWIDGSLVKAQDRAGLEPVKFRKFLLGGDFYRAGLDVWDGGMDSVKIYGEAKDTTFVLADFNATKSGYGR